MNAAKPAAHERNKEGSQPALVAALVADERWISRELRDEQRSAHQAAEHDADEQILACAET